MDFLTTLHRSGGVAALARQLGVAPSVSAAAVETLLPALVSGYRRLHEARGMEGLQSLLVSHGGVSLAAEVMSMAPADPAPGRALAGHLVPESGRILATAGNHVHETGTDREFLERMLPLLAMLTSGYLSAIVPDGGGRGTAMASLLAGYGRANRLNPED